jgi:hypothetical protein
MRRLRFAVIACVGMLALALSAVPAQAATDPVARAATSTVSQLDRGQGRAAAWECPYGYSCYYDDDNGLVPLTPPLRCGVHDLRGGPYQNKINSVFNNSSAWVYLDIWRNAGYWVEYARIRPNEKVTIYTNDIDRIWIVC